MWASQLIVELNFDWSEFQFNKIPLKRIGMHIGGKGIQNLFMNIVLLKKLLKRHKYEKTPFHVCYLGMK
jgi:hypothetical protein